MKIAVVIYSNDSETVWNAFRFATTSRIYEDDVTVFLLGRGVEAPTVSTLIHDVDEQIDLYRQNDGKIIGCGICCENRVDEMPNLKDQLQCEMGSMQQLYGLIAEADKVITF